MPKSQEKGDFTYAIKYIDELIQAEMDEYAIKGLTAALVGPNGIIWQKGYGVENTATGKKADTGTFYRIGGISKLFTAAAVLNLVSEGKVVLDAPVEKYLSDFSVKTGAQSSKKPVITIRHLLAHHSGLPYDKFSDMTTNDQFLINQPGYKYGRSNLDYAVLGRVIEKVSGMKHEDYIKKVVFSKLGMKNSFIGTKTLPSDKLPLAYTTEKKDIRETAANMPFNHTASGSGISTVEDMALFLQHIFSAPPYLKEMSRIQYPDNDNDLVFKSGLGWIVNYLSVEGLRNITCFGTMMGFQSIIAALPDEKLGLVIMSNSSSFAMAGPKIANRSLNLMLQAQKGTVAEIKMPEYREIKDSDISQFRKFEGKYVDGGFVVDVTADKNKLKILSGSTELSLVPVGKNRFKIVKELWFWFWDIKTNYFIDFYASKDGSLRGLLSIQIEEGNFPVMVFEKPKNYVVPDYFKPYAGRYRVKVPVKILPGQFFYKEFEIKIEGTWLTGEAEKQKFLLYPVSEDTAIWADMNARFKNGTIEIGGLLYEKIQ